MKRHCYITNQNSAIDFLSKLSSDTEQVFGHTVIYFVTDPDKRT
jgi:hypothetical protein